jgi:hypothetical protein
MKLLLIARVAEGCLSSKPLSRNCRAIARATGILPMTSVDGHNCRMYLPQSRYRAPIVLEVFECHPYDVDG